MADPAVVARRLRADILHRMAELARENRTATLEVFRELLVPELVKLVMERFPEVPIAAAHAMVPACVTVIGNRLTIGFDLLAERALDPEGTAEPCPDTERP